MAIPTTFGTDSRPFLQFLNHPQQRTNNRIHNESLLWDLYHLFHHLIILSLSLIFLGQRIAAASQRIVRQDFDGSPTNGAQTRAVVGPVQAHAATIAARHSMPTCPTLSGRSRQEEGCQEEGCQEVVQEVCQNKKDRFSRRGKLHGQKQHNPQHVRRHLHPMNATSTSRSWHTTHLCEKLGYTGGVWLHKCRLNKCAARKCFNHNRYRFVS